jgi:hypothetical protein
MDPIDRISVEPSRRCSKGCSFCYNGSDAAGSGSWSPDDLIAFVRDCAASSVRAVSFGGGEPLEWDGIFDVLRALRGDLFRSLTTNGLPLERPGVVEALLDAHPDKVHLSIHAPENGAEVRRVIAWTVRLAAFGLRTGVNLLVRRSRLAEATAAHAALRGARIEPERIVLLPMRGEGGHDTPSPNDVAAVADGPFQSMSCLRGCAKSRRFASIDADRKVAWCSYTVSRAALDEPTYTAMRRGLDGLELIPCSEQLVAVRRSAGASSRV